MTDSSKDTGTSAPALRLDHDTAQAVARGLGWYSIAVGVAELLLPEMMARATGTRGVKTLLRVYGMREIATGVGILASADPRPWLWARVGGDALDAATLAVQLRGGGARTTNTAVSLAAVAGVTALDLACARALDAQPAPASAPPVDYSDRRGLGAPPEALRGAALDDFVVPRDMQTPLPLAPYTTD